MIDQDTVGTEPIANVDSNSSELRAEPPVRQAIAGILVAAATVGAAWFLVQGLGQWLRMMLFAGLAIAPFLKLRWYVAGCLFVLLWAWLIEPSFRYYRPTPLLEITRVVVLMFYISMSMRVSDIDFGQWFGRRTKKVVETTGSPFDSETIELEDSKLTYQSLHPLTAGWYWVPVSVIFSMSLLKLVPLDPFSPEKIGILPVAWRAILMVWLVVAIWLFAGGFLNLLTAKMKDKDRAHVYIRSTYCRQLAKELGSIEKYRTKRISKLIRKNRKNG